MALDGEANNGRSFSFYRGDTLREEFYPYLESYGDIIDAFFTMKDQKNCPDSDALIQVSLLDGLRVINGQPATNPANGSVSIINGRCSVFVDEVETAKLDPALVWWDFQIIRNPDFVETPYLTKCHILAESTRST